MVLIKNAIEEMVSCTNSRLTHTMSKDENRFEVRLWFHKSERGNHTNDLRQYSPQSWWFQLSNNHTFLILAKLLPRSGYFNGGLERASPAFFSLYHFPIYQIPSALYRGQSALLIYPFCFRIPRCTSWLILLFLRHVSTVEFHNLYPQKKEKIY